MITTNLMAPRVSRKLRNPAHSFTIKHAPFEIQPFFIAPVLPGETMKNLSLQSRAISNPLKSQLTGWWLEYYFFYVKHRDLNDPTVFTELMLDASATLTAHEDYKVATAEAFTGWLSAGTGMDWVKACLRPVIETYFRDQGEAWNAATIDSNPAAYVNMETWLQSAELATAMDAVDVTIPIDATPAPDVAYASDVLRALRNYELLKAQGLVDMTYEDYLRSFGVRIVPEVENKPELIRYIREWTYPTSAVQPNSAVAGAADVSASAVWSIAERADKDRFFREPGFIFGVTCARPKVYSSVQKRPAVSLLDDAYSWLPAMLAGQTDASWKEITDAATDILGGNATGNWWVDVKDLFLHGDQFTNQTDLSALNGMALPSTAMGVKHPVQASVDAMFISADATGGIRQDGIVRLSILGQQSETSPRGSSFAG